MGGRTESLKPAKWMTIVPARAFSELHIDHHLVRVRDGRGKTRNPVLQIGRGALQRTWSHQGKTWLLIY